MLNAAATLNFNSATNILTALNTAQNSHSGLERGVVVEEWHQGIIIPLYKGNGSKSECSNYRGITLLSVPGKVFAPCKNQTNIVVTQASSAKRIHAWPLYM